MAQPDPVTALSQAHRDHLAAYVAEPLGATPPWFFPAMGIAIGGIIASGYVAPPVVGIPVVLVMGALMGVATGARVARHGAMPRFQGMPPSLRGLLVGYWAVTGMLVGGVALIAGFIEHRAWQFALILMGTALIVGVGGWITERRYLAEARRLARAAGIR